MQNIVSGVKKNGGVALKMGRGGGRGVLDFYQAFFECFKEIFYSSII